MTVLHLVCALVRFCISGYCVVVARPITPRDVTVMDNARPFFDSTTTHLCVRDETSQLDSDHSRHGRLHKWCSDAYVCLTFQGNSVSFAAKFIRIIRQSNPTNWARWQERVQAPRRKVIFQLTFALRARGLFIKSNPESALRLSRQHPIYAAATFLLGLGTPRVNVALPMIEKTAKIN